MKTTLAKLEDAYRQNPVAACRKALRLTRHIPKRDRLEEINKLLGTFGTEAIRGEWQNGYWCDVMAVYCNAGDTYAVTVIQVRGKCRFIVSTVGDFVESMERKGVEIK